MKRGTTKHHRHYSPSCKRDITRVIQSKKDESQYGTRRNEYHHLVASVQLSCIRDQTEQQFQHPDLVRQEGVQSALEPKILNQPPKRPRRRQSYHQILCLLRRRVCLLEFCSSVLTFWLRYMFSRLYRLLK